MSNDINKIGMFGILSDLKAREFISNEELNNIWEECNSDGSVTKDELMGSIMEIIPKEELSSDELEILSAIQGEEKIEEGAWNNWMNNESLNSSSGISNTSSGIQNGADSSKNTMPTISPANLAGSSSDLRARRNEDMSKLAELKNQKENNEVINNAKKDVELAKTTYDEALALVEQSGGNEEVERIQGLKANNNTEISNQNTIKINLNTDISSAQGRISSLKSQLAGVSQPQKESENDTGYEERLQAYEAKKAQLEQQIRQEEDLLSNLNQQLASCEAKIQELENSNLDLDLQLETYLAEQDFEDGSALENLQEALSAYNQAQITLRQIEQEQNNQIDANIAQLEANLASYDSAIASAEIEEGIQNTDSATAIEQQDSIDFGKSENLTQTGQNEEYIANLENDNDKEFARALLSIGYTQEEVDSLIKENQEYNEYNQNVSQIDNYQKEATNELTLKYLSKPLEECTTEEINNVYALYMIENVLTSCETGLEKQDNSDGIISEAYDFIKEVTSLGICQEDVEKAIAKQEGILNTLKETLLNGGDFAKTYQELTGVEYNPEKISEYYQKTTELQFVSIGMQKVNVFNQALEKAKDDPEEMLDLYIEFYGDEELAREKFGDDLLYSVQNEFNSDQVSDIIITEDNEVINIYTDGTQETIGDVSSLYGRVLLGMYNENGLQRKTDEYLTNFEKATGINYQDLVKEQSELSKEALGEANAVSNLLNDYIASQESFIDGFNSFVQIGGMCLMVTGGIASFIPGGQGIGMAMVKTGQVLSVAGTFGDEAMELLDTATNENSYEQDKNHYRQIGKDLLTDGALFATGYLIGGASNAIAENIKGSKALAKLAEIGFDSSASLLTDLIITGEVDFKGEGFSQMLSILTGCAAAKWYSSGKTDADINTRNKSQTPYYDPNKIDWTAKGEYRRGYNPQSVQEVLNIPDLTDVEAARLDFLYKHFDNLGYGNLINQHPRILLDVFQADNAELAGYHNMGKDEFAIIAHAQKTFDSPDFKPEWAAAIADRTNMSAPYNIFKYWQNPDLIPQDGVPHNLYPEVTRTKDEVVGIINTQIIPLHECLDAQSTPIGITAYRGEDLSIFNGIEFNGKPMAQIMSSNNPELIQEALTAFNKGDFDVTYDNFVGTSIGSTCFNAEEVLWTINVPQGSKAMFLCVDDPKTEVLGIMREKEFLLQMGSVFRIKSANYIQLPNGKYQWQFDVDLVQE